LALLPYSRHLPSQRSMILTALKHFGLDIADVVERLIENPNGVDDATLNDYWFDKSNGNIFSFIALMLMTTDSYRRMVDDVVGDNIKGDPDKLSMTELLWVNSFLFSQESLLPQLALKKVRTDAELVLYMHILSMSPRECDRNPLVKRWAKVAKSNIAA
jgi:hypothetical protein